MTDRKAPAKEASAARAEGERSEPLSVLKACPFCGCDAQLYRDGAGDFEVFCNGDDCEAQTGYVPTSAMAIAAWNRRSDPVWEEMLEALKAAADVLEDIGDGTCGYNCEREGSFPDSATALSKARAAIARAEADAPDTVKP